MGAFWRPQINKNLIVTTFFFKQKPVFSPFLVLQLHSERDPGAGHPAGTEPRVASALYHASHRRHEETGGCLPSSLSA